MGLAKRIIPCLDVTAGRVEDLRRLAAIPGVVGAVVGRALYTGAIDLRQASAVVAVAAPPR